MVCLFTHRVSSFRKHVKVDIYQLSLYIKISSITHLAEAFMH